MIKARVILTTGHHSDPSRAPGSEREAIKTVNEWIRKATANAPIQQVPVIPVGGHNGITKKEYQEFRNALRHSSYPCPIGITLNNHCFLWAEDERALPNTLEQAKATLLYFDLTRTYRLPL